MRKLDLRDRKILNEIEMNARITHSQLAKKLNTSKQVVKYRIEQLEKENIIQGYFAIIDVIKLGYFIHIIYLKFTGLSSQKENQWHKQIDKHPAVLSTGKNAGNWDLTIVIKARNNQELDIIYKELIKGKSDKIKDKIVTSQIESTYFTETIFYNKQGKEATTAGGEEVKIDEKDEKLIAIVAEHGRASLIELSEKLNLSPNSVKQRLRHLEDKEVIVGWKTKINYEKLGFLHFRVFIHAKNMSQDFYKQIKQYLKQRGNVESVGRFWGYADIDFRIHVRDIFELYNQIAELKDKFIENIVDVDSMIIVGWEGINYYPARE
ncbi:MAG: Lrp/AsnC family transcriptional regulator [Candidatus Nanoarchaeia archaeon]